MPIKSVKYKLTDSEEDQLRRDIVEIKSVSDITVRMNELIEYVGRLVQLAYDMGEKDGFHDGQRE